MKVGNLTVYHKTKKIKFLNNRYSKITWKCFDMVNNRFDTLESAFNQLVHPEKESLPSALPLFHLTLAQNLTKIVEDIALKPQYCRVFKKNLLYFSYGGLFYIPGGDRNSRNAAQAPIALLFKPTLIEQIDIYYPYDTGAVKQFNQYGSHSEELQKFNRYRIHGHGDPYLPSKLVYHLYKNNSNYRIGIINQSCGEYPEPFPQLFKFLNTDLSEQRCDERQYTIECQATRNIYLQDNLEWIGIPESLFPQFQKLFKAMSPSPPFCYQYTSHSIINPTKIVGKLEAAAEQYIERYLEPQRIN